MHTHTDIGYDAPTFREEAHEEAVSALARELARADGLNFDDLDTSLEQDEYLDTARDMLAEMRCGCGDFACPCGAETRFGR